MKGKNLALFSVIAMASATIAYALYRAGVIKNEHYSGPYKAVKKSIRRKLKIISGGHAVPKARGRLSKKR